MYVCMYAQWLTLCGPVDCNLPDSSVHGIFQARNTGVGCHSSSRGIFLTHWLNPSLLLGRQIFYHWATREALKSNSYILFLQLPRKNAAKVMVAWLRANVPFPNPVRTPPHLSRVSGFPASRETGSCGQCRLGGDGAGSGWHTEALAATDLVQDSGLGARRAEIGSPWWQDLLHAVYKHISCHLGPVPVPGLHPGKPSRVTHTHTHCTLM